MLAAVLVGAALAAGCGIRSTSVPVDAGAAPSRVPCRTPAQDVTAQSLEEIQVQIYLVCASRLVTVSRSVRLDAVEPDRIRVARVLLDELQQEPVSDERQAGFSTGVPVDLRVTEGREGDPAGALRLNEQPEDLPAEALAQLVCSYTDSEMLVTGGTVVLGGPGNYEPRGYLCTSQTKTRPGDVTTPRALQLP
ncbi:hypothetical protein [Streptomyces sp. NPDC055749]